MIKGWLRRARASGLWAGLTLRQSFTNWLNYLLHLLASLNPWTGLSFNCHIAINGLRCEFGTTPSANSIAVTPNDQISVLFVYSLCFITSGLIQYGDPTCDLCPALVYILSALTPKSANLAIPSLLSKIFAAFISL